MANTCADMCNAIIFINYQLVVFVAVNKQQDLIM